MVYRAEEHKDDQPRHNPSIPLMPPSALVLRTHIRENPRCLRILNDFILPDAELVIGVLMDEVPVEKLVEGVQHCIHATSLLHFISAKLMKRRQNIEALEVASIAETIRNRQVKSSALTCWLRQLNQAASLA